MKDLRELTIVVFTRNRPHFVQRQVEYWCGTNAQLLILDGSEEPNISISKSTNHNPNILYLYSPGWATRYRLASEKVQTEFVVTISDDEFMLPEGLVYLINYLKNNPLLGTCMGQCLDFDSRNSSNNLDELYLKRISLRYDNLQHSILDSSPKKRVFSRFSTYLGPLAWYAVQRSWVYRTSFGVLAAMGEPENAPNFLHFDLYETTFELVSAYLAPSACIGSLYWLRSMENSPSYLDDNRLPIDVWSKSPDGNSRIKQWSKIIAGHLSTEMEEITTDSQLFLEGLDTYINSPRSRSRRVFSLYSCLKDLKLAKLLYRLMGGIIKSQRHKYFWVRGSQVPLNPWRLNIPTKVIEQTAWSELSEVALFYRDWLVKNQENLQIK